MRILARILPICLLLCLGASPAGAQYMYLDSNGDGVNSREDLVNLNGVTTVDVWLDTNSNRDGSAAVCSTEPGTALTINSYAIILKVVNGTVAWGPLQNRLPIVTSHGIVNFASGWQDTTGATEYFNGWGGRDIFAPGRYRLATLTFRVTSGSPSLLIASSMPPKGSALTAFGTQCMGLDDDNTLKLGQEWFDADGIGLPIACAGGPYVALVTQAVAFSAAGTVSPRAGSFTYSWDFGDGDLGDGLQASHAYAAPGTYTVTLTVDGGASRAVTTAIIAPADARAPVADAGGPYKGTTRSAVQFEGGRSYDPNGDPLRFVWQYGDGGSAGGVRPIHLYLGPGTYGVALTVDDGALQSTATTTAEIAPAPQHAPIAVAGGPYAGVAGRIVRFDGSASSDPDGDPLTFRWDFGDRRWGLGMYGYHAYDVPGEYRVWLRAMDGIDTASAYTSASIAQQLPARAFTLGTPATFELTGDRPTLQIQLEPVDGSFPLLEVDLNLIELRSPGTGVESSAYAFMPVSYLGDDTDGNGVKEVTAIFLRDDLSRLFANITETTHLTVELAAHLNGGGVAAGTLGLDVVVQGPLQPARVSPNPMNPTGVLSFETRVPGRLRVEVFDLHGRLVRVLMDQAAAAARKYALRIGGEGGPALASGIYFYRIASAAGVSRGRFAVMK